MSDDVSSQSNNDLPTAWPIKTSSNSALHHEDLPLFPPLAEKKKLEPATQEPLIESPVSIDLIENEPLEEIESGINENLINSGVSPQDFEIKKEEKLILENSEKPILENIQNTPIALVSEISEEIESKQNPPQGNSPQSDSIEIINDAPVLISENIKINESLATKQINTVNAHLNLVTSKKQIPVPHAKINETVRTEHPLSLPPRVIPFSTPAPSVHTKIASVYTQPEARASVWLPWMRTSMWSKKMVKKATRNPEIKETHAGLPTIKEEKKPNVIYSPVFVSPGIPLMDKSLFEPKAEVVRMNYEKVENVIPIEKIIPEAPPVIEAVVEQKIQESVAPVVTENIVPEIKDVIDNEIFGVKTVPQKPLNNSDLNVVKKIDKILKPKIEDSWDAALFN